MTSRRRWTVVAIVVAVLGFTPYLVSRLPVGDSDVSAGALLTRINASADVPFSGYAEANGAIGLPDTDRFSDLAALLGGTTDLRIWWRAGRDWRVDAVSVTGEDDVHQDSGGIWTWNYESNRAQRVAFTVAPAARLPRADDLAPGSLARRLLAQATAGEVHRIDSVRVAGRSVPGLELVPDQPESTIGRVDVWATPDTGLPLQVQVYGRSGPAVLSTTMLDLTTDRPTPADTDFAPPGNAEIDQDGITDVVSALNQFVAITPPRRLAGLSRARGSTQLLGSVGVYGRGVTAMVALPFPPRFVYDVGAQLAGVATEQDGADVLSVGPLSLRYTAPADNGSRWLLAGTVTQQTLARAEKQLPSVPDDGP